MASLGDIAQRAQQPSPDSAFGGQAPTFESSAFPQMLSGLGNILYQHSPLAAIANAVNLTGDVARGQATLEDPSTQQRAVGAGTNLAMSMGGAPESALGAGFQFRFPKGIIAYHGSPHTFEQFDPAKIGTGEGAQAYGHGLYFAENEDVAKSYRQSLSPTTNAEHVAQFYLDRNNGNRELAIKHAQDVVEHIPKANPTWGREQEYKDALSLLQNPDWKMPGSTYQVRLHADPEEFLNFNKSLSEQNPLIRQFFKRQGQVERAGDYIKPSDDAYYDLAQNLSPGRFARGTQQASQALEQAGVPGISYLDRGSRTAGEGSRNYVVFNPQIIDILKRYGLTGPGLAALAYMASQQQQQNANPISQ